MFSLEVGQWQFLLIKTHKGHLTESVVLFIYLSPVFQRTENENHGHCYLPYLSGSSSLLFLLLTAPCIINHTWSTESSSECSSLFHSAQIFCYSKQKSVKDLHVGQKTKILKFTWTITHLSGHSPRGGQSLKGRALTSKSNAWGMEEEIIAYVNDETPLMSDPSSWSALAFISSPLIALLSLKIWVRMVRFQPKKRTACASECRPQCAGQIGEGQEPLHSAVYCHQIPRALNENHRANPAGRDLWKSLAQASAQSRASSKIWSGCSGPFSINTWKSPETAQLFWVILSRVWTHALGKKFPSI